MNPQQAALVNYCKQTWGPQIEKIVEFQLEAADMMKLEASYKALAAKEVFEREQEVTKTNQRTLDSLELQAKSIIRPTTALRPEVTQDPTGWTAAYGEVVGAGPTPELACQDFDRLWLGKDEI
jgi:hypothetical protein